MGWGSGDLTAPAMASTTIDPKSRFINAAAPPNPQAASQSEGDKPSSTEPEKPPIASATSTDNGILAGTNEPASTMSSSTTATAVQTQHQTSEPSSSGGLPTTTKIAIAVPVAVAGLAILLALIFFLVRRRRNKNNNRTSQPPPYQVGEWPLPMPSTQKLVEPIPQPLPELAKPKSPPVGTLQVPETSVSRAGSQRTLSAVSDMSGHSLGSPDLGDEAVEFGTAIQVQVNSRRYSANQEDLIAGRPSRLLPRASENSGHGQTRAGEGRRLDHDAISEVSATETERGRGGRRGYEEALEPSPVSPSSERRFV